MVVIGFLIGVVVLYIASIIARLSWAAAGYNKISIYIAEAQINYMGWQYALGNYLAVQQVNSHASNLEYIVQNNLSALKRLLYNPFASWSIWSLIVDPQERKYLKNLKDKGIITGSEKELILRSSALMKQLREDLEE